MVVHSDLTWGTNTFTSVPSKACLEGQLSTHATGDQHRPSFLPYSLLLLILIGLLESPIELINIDLIETLLLRDFRQRDRQTRELHASLRANTDANRP